jgi:hypothetical protein
VGFVHLVAAMGLSGSLLLHLEPFHSMLLVEEEPPNQVPYRSELPGWKSSS